MIVVSPAVVESQLEDILEAMDRLGCFKNQLCCGNRVLVFQGPKPKRRIE